MGKKKVSRNTDPGRLVTAQIKLPRSTLEWLRTGAKNRGILRDEFLADALFSTPIRDNETIVNANFGVTAVNRTIIEDTRISLGESEEYAKGHVVGLNLSQNTDNDDFLRGFVDGARKL
jgi:hypothetical protein|tara:strand:- start:4397 stop:4753 length:357 start_codon:yes stop_codon:yes gene_type:complete